MFTLNFLNSSGSSSNTEPHLGCTAAERHFNNLHSPKALDDVPIWWKDVQTNQWQLGTLLTWGRGSPGWKEHPLWVPSRCINPYHGSRIPVQCDNHSPDKITTDHQCVYHPLDQSTKGPILATGPWDVTSAPPATAPVGSSSITWFGSTWHLWLTCFCVVCIIFN